MTGGDDLLNLPSSLQNVTGVGKERLIELKALRLLGLKMSVDEPFTDKATGKVTPAVDVFYLIHKHARRYMLPKSKEVPMEDREEWKK